MAKGIHLLGIISPSLVYRIKIGLAKERNAVKIDKKIIKMEKNSDEKC